MITEVESSFIERVEYEEDKRELRVYIDNNSEREQVYIYDSVPPHVFEEFLNSDSKGSYYNNNIKGRYESIPLSKVAGLI